MTDTKNEKKDELVRTLNNTEKEGRELVSSAKEALKWAQFTVDMARNTRDMVDLLPGNFFSEKGWDEKIKMWGKLGTAATTAKIDIGNQLSQLVVTANSTAVSSVTILSSSAIPFLPQENREAAWGILHRFEQILEQSNQIDEIGKEIKRLDFKSVKSGTESILDQLKQADVALKAPSGKETAATGVLIPLREAIDMTIDILLKRRPTQEVTKNNIAKIQSIIGQTGRSSIDSTQTKILAETFDKLKSDLSGGKNKVFSRNQLRELTNEGILFLLTLLESIDEKKLK